MSEYPILEYLIMGPLYENNSKLQVQLYKTSRTLQAPNLHHLALFGDSLPIGSQLLITAVGLVLSSPGTPIRLLPAKYFVSMDLIHTTTRDPRIRHSISRDVERQLHIC